MDDVIASNNSHLPEQRPLFTSLATIQGSFPCSNKEITAGFELESPDHKKWDIIMLWMPQKSDPVPWWSRKIGHYRKDHREMKMKLQLQPIGAAHFQFFHFIPTQTISWDNREQKFSWLLEKKIIYNGERRYYWG